MSLDVKHFLLSHLVWVVGLAVALVAIHSWLGEHDARLRAEATIRVSEQQVSSLEDAIKSRDQQSASQIAPIVKIIHDVRTVPEVIKALPTVMAAPLPQPIALPKPGDGVTIPPPDLVPLFDQLADDKVCRLELSTMSKDLVDTQGIVAQRNDEIVALKQKPTFWKRLTGTVKTLGIGVGIGLALGHKF